MSWMTGASAGMAKQYDYSVGGPIDDTDDTDTGFRAFAGMIFHPNLGVLVSYVDLGEANYSGPAFGGFTDKLSADGFDLSFLGGFKPGSQEAFTVFGTTGVFFWQQDVHYVDPGEIFDVSENGASLSLAAGGEFAIGAGAKWGIHFEWQRFFDVGDPDKSGHEYDRDLVSAGFTYRFGK